MKTQAVNLVSMSTDIIKISGKLKCRNILNINYGIKYDTEYMIGFYRAGINTRP